MHGIYCKQPLQNTENLVCTKDTMHKQMCTKNFEYKRGIILSHMSGDVEDLLIGRTKVGSTTKTFELSNDMLTFVVVY